MLRYNNTACDVPAVSVLFNEPKLLKFGNNFSSNDNWNCFSALQRAEIAEIARGLVVRLELQVSVLFNEPKLLKSGDTGEYKITEITFQCSSTSRNC